MAIMQSIVLVSAVLLVVLVNQGEPSLIYFLFYGVFDLWNK